MRYIFLLVFVLFSLSAKTQSNLVEGSVSLVGEDTLVIEGVIGPTSAKKFHDLLTPKITTVRVTSEGGVTFSAMEIAESIQKRRLRVVVRNYCISSCANYIFVAGFGRVVERDSVVAWHGGHSDNPLRSADGTIEAARGRAALVRREQLLYLRAGVSLDLIIYSGWLTLGVATGEAREVVAFGIPTRTSVAEREYNNWVPPPHILRKLGFSQSDDLWHPGSAAGVEDVLRKHGFSGSKIYIGGPYEYVPKFLQLENHPTQ